MNYFEIVAGQIAIFVVYAMIGVAAVKCGVVNRDGLTVLSRLITKIALPLLIFTNTINGTTREDFLSSLVIIAGAAVLYVVLYVAAVILTKVFHVAGARANVYCASFLFANVGFMGIPIVTSLFPERGAMYIAVFSAIDQFMLWTVGVQIISSGGKTGQSGILQAIRKMLNPAVICNLIGITLVLTGIHLPQFINTAFTKTGGAATPLALFYLGGIFCYCRVSDFLRDRELYAMALVKMVVIPIMTAAVFHWIPSVPSEIAVTLSVICGLPPMASVAMIAESLGSDNEYASGVVFLTTLCSAVTLPVVCMLIQGW